ncbi:MAG: NAD(P)/FAD-dependent oxidoreductase, partial [Mariprofundaceae bacterium]|nr:NAD(P)/FAD-dependent oxidoreductase [Mariprofundaceae bacterium]
LRILLLDHAEKPGKKILISGGSRCNFTNMYTSHENFLCSNPHFCKSALSRFSAADFISMVEARGIPYHERQHGQLFCNDSACDIVEMLLDACHDGGVTMRMNTEVSSVKPLDNTVDTGFSLSTNAGDFQCRQLVIASGGLSLPKIGASAFGLKLAGQFGLPVLAPRAGLVPFTFTGTEMQAIKELAGISLDVRVSCRGTAFREAMLFTHRGLSGPAILQISSYWQPGDAISVDLLPGHDIAAELEASQTVHPQAQLITMLAHMLPKRLVRLLCDTGLIHDKKMEKLSAAERDLVAQQLHDWQLKPAGTEGYRTAEVTLGGVDTHALSSKDMQVKSIPCLYFIGEVVDVTGHLGGFNFQWAWSSGHACGMAL